MIQKVTPHPDGTFDIHLACDYCGKPITRSVASGMTCEDLCTNKWVRWDRLNRPGFLEYLDRLGQGEAARLEKDTLFAHLFNEVGQPKFGASQPPPPPKKRRGRQT